MNALPLPVEPCPVRKVPKKRRTPGSWFPPNHLSGRSPSDGTPDRRYWLIKKKEKAPSHVQTPTEASQDQLSSGWNAWPNLLMYVEFVDAQIQEVPSRTADTRRWRFCAGRHGTDDVVLLVAIFTVHLPNGFSSIKLMSYDAAGAHFGQPGYETDLLYIACLLALCIGGAGPLSLDSYLKGQRHV
jgi:hypothetical protein